MLPTRLRRFLRRAFGIFLGLLPLGLLLSSIAFGGAVGTTRWLAAAGVMVPGLYIALYNCFLTFLLPRRWLRQHGTMEGMPHTSVVPLVGTILVAASALVGFGSVAIALAGIAVLVLDTGGAPWFLVAVWRDESFWDASN